ncbi:MAG: geranylgeranylglycerol-phosphate geranylgeranyltransferase [Bacteroidota bacterium]
MILNYIKLTRPINLLIIVLVQCIIKYGLLLPLGVKVALDNFEFFLLVFASLCIAAAGNVVNDIFDLTVDSINKPDKMLVWRIIPEKSAYNYYIVLNVLGVAAGFYLSNLLDKPALTAIFIVISALLYIYATHIKAMLVVGNLLVSVVVAMSLMVIVLFDIFPALDTNEMDLQVVSSKIILLYAGFAFYINFIREIVKDLQDIDGDKNGGRNSLPIALGRQRTIHVVFVLGVMGLIGILLYSYYRLYYFSTLLFYFVFLIAGPMLFFCIKAWSAETKKDYAFLSLLLKLIMLSGIISIVFYAKIATQL